MRYSLIVVVFVLVSACSKNNGPDIEPAAQDTVLRVTLTNNGNTIRKLVYQYDAQKRVTRMDDSVTNAVGSAAPFSWVASTEITYNAAGRMATIRNSASTSPTSTNQLTYSADGRTAILNRDPLVTVLSNHYALDDQGRILSDTPYVSGVASSEIRRLVYDAVGNLKALYTIALPNDTLVWTSFTHDNRKNPYYSLPQAQFLLPLNNLYPNNLLREDFRTKAGNTGTRVQWTYTYNNLNRPSEALSADNIKVSYTFKN